MAGGFGQDVHSTYAGPTTHPFTNLLVSFRYNAGTIMNNPSGGTSLKVDGTEYYDPTHSSGNAFNFSAGRAFIGGSADSQSGSGFTGDVAEVIVYNSVLSTTQENLIGYYLAQKYGIASAYTSPGSSWTGTNSTTWNDAGNWTGAAPGVAGATDATATNGDTATFNAFNATNPAPVVDAGRNLQNIVFDNSTSTLTSSLTLGTTTGNALLLTSGGSITSTPSVANAQAVNAPLILEGTGGTYSFINNATSATATLNFGGPITAGATSGTTTLTLKGTNTGANTISGAIGGGNGATLALTAQSGNWVLAGTNTYAGATTVTGGTLTVGNGTSGSLSSSTPISVTGGTLSLAPGGSIGNTSIAVSGSGTFAPLPTSGGSLSTGATLSLGVAATGGTFSMVDGQLGTFNLTSSGTALSLNAGSLNFDLSSSGADKLEIPTGTAAVSGVNTIGITPVGSSLSVGNTYPLISVPAGGLNGGTYQFTGGLPTRVVSAGGTNYKLSLQSTSTAVSVSVAAGPTLPVTANLYAWYDATNSVTANGSGVVQNWADLSGNGRDLGFVNGSPVLNPTGFNGQPAVQLNNQNDYLRSTNTFTGGLAGSPNLTVFWVGAMTGGNDGFNNRSGFIFGTNPGLTNFEVTDVNNTTTNNLVVATGFGQNLNTTYTGANTNLLFSFRYTAGMNVNDPTTSVKANGVEVANQAGSPGANVALQFLQRLPMLAGQRASPSGLGTDSGGFTGDVSEIIVYNGVLTDAQEDAVGYYLSQKYGLTTAYTPPGSFWTGGASTTNWADGGNWSGNVPGATTGTANADTAIFNQAVSFQPFTIDAGRNVMNITFDTAAVSSMTVGTTTGHPLLLTSGGTVQTTAAVTNPQTVNAPLVLEGNYTFTSGATTTAATLSFGGAIKPDASLTSGPTTLTLNGSNAGANTIGGVLSDNGSAQLAVAVTGTGVWIYSGATHTYTGGTTIASGATLQLAGSVSTMSQSMNIANSGSLVVASTTNQNVGTILGSTGNTTVNSGSLTAYQIRQNSLTINGTSTVTLIPSGSGTNSTPAAPNNINFSSNVTSLSIAGTTDAWTGTLDIGNNGLVIQYGSGTDPYTTVVNMIKSGYANGHWTGAGITSSLARAAVVLGSPTPALNIGLLDFVPNTGLFGSSISFEGQTISTSAILVRLTYMDDLVLAGDMAQANATSDALFFAANYGSGTTWHVGDITHDGVIDTNDALLFAANYVVGLPSLDGTTGNAAAIGGNAAAVPEPASVVLAAVGLLGLSLAARPRRSSKTSA